MPFATSSWALVRVGDRGSGLGDGFGSCFGDCGLA